MFPVLVRGWRYAKWLGGLGTLISGALGFPSFLDWYEPRSFHLTRPYVRAPLAEHQRPEFAALIRNIYRDGTATPQETADLMALAQRKGVTATSVVQLDADLRQRVVLANESLVRGTVLVESGRLDRARIEFESATRIDSEDPRAWSNLGATDALVDRTVEARAAYDRALSLDPGDWATRYNFGLLLARTGEPQAALPQLGRALAAMRALPLERSPLAKVLDELQNSPSLAPLRAQPGFAALVRGG
jgi:Flp pilus assembly protein TadD